MLGLLWPRISPQLRYKKRMAPAVVIQYSHLAEISPRAVCPLSHQLVFQPIKSNQHLFGQEITLARDGGILYTWVIESWLAPILRKCRFLEFWPLTFSSCSSNSAKFASRVFGRPFWGISPAVLSLLLMLRLLLQICFMSNHHHQHTHQIHFTKKSGRKSSLA